MILRRNRTIGNKRLVYPGKILKKSRLNTRSGKLNPISITPLGVFNKSIYLRRKGKRKIAGIKIKKKYGRKKRRK